jgi:hypothetical protein
MHAPTTIVGLQGVDRMTYSHATRLIFAAAAAAGLMVAGAVRAQDTPVTKPAPPAASMPPGAGPAAGMHPPRPRGERMDADGDHMLTRAELLDRQKRQLERFDQADADKDGKLTGEERRAFHAAQAGDMRHDHGSMHHHHGEASPTDGNAKPATSTTPMPMR